jgi:hypothetical protein
MKKIIAVIPAVALVLGACSETVTGPDPQFAKAMSGGPTSRLVVELNTDFGFCTAGGNIVISGEVTVTNTEAGSNPGMTTGLDVRVSVTGKNPPYVTNWAVIQTSANLASAQLALDATAVYPFSIQFSPTGYTQFKVFAYGDVTNPQGGGWPLGDESGDFTIDIQTLSPCGTACVRGQGYWKNHFELWPTGTYTDFFSTGKTWLEVFNTSASPGQPYMPLAYQYMAASLNAAMGATMPAGVSTAFTLAGTWFTNRAFGDSETTDPSKETVEGWKDLLENFNEGGAGVAQCTGA